MSTAAPAFDPGGRTPSSAERMDDSERRAPLPLELYLRRVPVQDWITFILLGVMLVAVGWAVQLSGWGDLPSLYPTLLLGWLAGFIASRSSLPTALKIVLAMVVGFAVVMWQGSIPAEGSNVADRARDAWDRFWVWITIAREGGVSNDSVPFALMFMTASWITAYGITALTFRVRNPWTPIVLLAVGLMSNLSFRPGLHEQTFFIFIIASIALFAHLTAVRRMDRWNARGVKYPPAMAWLSMTDGLVFGGIIVLLVVFLPIFEPRSQTLDDAWDFFKSPVEALQDPANRLLSGVKANEREIGLNQPDDVLPFKGPIELQDEPLAWVTSRYATMLPGRVYDTYASTGWLATPEVTRTVDARDQLIPVPQEEGRERIDQLIQPLVDTNLVLPAGNVFSVDRDSEIEYLVPASYRVPLTGPVGSLADFPDDVRELAFDTRFALREMAADQPGAPPVTLNSQPLMNEEQVLEVLREGGLPDELEIRLRLNGDRDVTALDVGRIGPPEPVGGVFTEPVEAEHLYNVITFVVTATDEELQESGTGYPGWIRDRYLSLPDSLPVDVLLLANQIVSAAGAQTPLEKVRAIQAFLQQQVYSQQIAGPDANQDGVFYFLFETQNEPCPTTDPDCDTSRIKGYSQYYGSAGTVLLRAVGVPSRMVAGWATGEYISRAGKFLIRDEDRHGWTQAYFEGFGWVDIEVTPGRDEPDRSRLFSVEPSLTGALPDIEAIEDDPDFLQDILDIEELAQQQRERLAQQRAEELANANRNDFPVAAVAIPASLVGILVLLYVGWQLWHRGMTPAEAAYTRMVRAGRVLGVQRKPWQTPTEFAAAIGDAAPGVADSAMLIAIEFERRRYAPKRDNDSADGLSKHWRRVLRGLLGYRVRLIGGAGPELGEGRGA